MHRGFGVATDDKKAIRILGKVLPTMPRTRTSQLVQAWAERAGIADAVLRKTLQTIRIRARFDPPSSDPLFEWWTRHS